MILKWSAIILLGVLYLSSVTSEEEFIQIYFCPEHDCEEAYLETLNSAKDSLVCALYELHLESIIFALDQKSKEIIISIVVEKDATHLEREYVHYDTNHALMHNKFCVVDEKLVITGSTNPTPNDIERNDNTIVIFKSKTIAKKYTQEANYLAKGNNKGQKGYTHANIANIDVEIFFCPQDSCANRLINLIRTAQEEIIFATFTFTDTAVANELLLAKQRGVNVTGVYERRMHTLYSSYQILNHQTANIFLDKNSGTMHHKFFIIDRKIVLTGSYNPTENGNTKNNENVIIMHNPKIADQYVQEYQRLIK